MVAAPVIWLEGWASITVDHRNAPVALFTATRREPLPPGRSPKTIRPSATAVFLVESPAIPVYDAIVWVQLTCPVAESIDHREPLRSGRKTVPPTTLGVPVKLPAKFSDHFCCSWD